MTYYLSSEEQRIMKSALRKSSKMINMADLPRPDVKASKPADAGEHAIDVVISRGNRARSFRGDGSTREQAVEKVVRQIIDTRDSLEWIP